MAVSLVPVFSIFTMLLLGGGSGLPISLPPLPEDPALARIAPEECLLYMNWSGMATPNAKSQNQTEQLLAEPEVQEAVVQIERAILGGIEKNSPPQQAETAREAIRWGEKLLTRPVMVFVSSVAITDKGPDIRGGLAINVGDDAADAKAALEKYQAALPNRPEKVDIGGISGYRLKLAKDAPAIAWGIQGNYLLAGIGEGSLEGILQREMGSAPAWLTALHKQLPVQRPATVTYVNVKKLVEQIAAPAGLRARAMIDAAGLGNVTTLASVTGLDGEGVVNRTLIGIEGKPAGLVNAALGKPLGLNDLTPIPCDANLAIVNRLDLARLIDTALDIARKIDPQMAADIDRRLKDVNEHLGVDLRRDVLNSLGDVWCAYNSPDEGGLLITGLTAVVQVKDYDRLAAAQVKLLNVAKAALGQASQAATKGTVPLSPPRSAGAPQNSGQSARIEHLQFAEQDIYFVSASGLPFAPAWCLTRTELIVAVYPQQIKAYLSRGADFKSLATLPAVAETFSGEEGPLGLSYFQPRGFLDYLYPLMCMGVQMASQDFARQGIDLNVSIIPAAPTIYKHLRPSVSVVRHTDAGFEIINRGTLPGSSLSSSAPVMAGLLLPALSKARESARRAQSMNNLKQIALAMFNYASTYNNSFPPAFRSNENGKPLLSWRVAILPFLEQDALYKQFHLDEPWDSEHNKKLLEQMPAVYRSPASPLRAAKPGMTNYLTVRGKDTAFPGKEGIKINEITDGTSNTIMVVEASDAKAVPWTKPDDFEYSEKNPADGLGGLFPGGFIAAMCDGSVRFISSAIDAETLRRLFNRHDGQPVDPGKF